MIFRNKNTKTFEVDGLIVSYQKGFPQFAKRRFAVRYTSDKVGKSLSIADEGNGVMFQIPLLGLVRPQGEWIFMRGVTCGGYYKCNNCGEVERAEKNYCPNCGADMKGGAE